MHTSYPRQRGLVYERPRPLFAWLAAALLLATWATTAPRFAPAPVPAAPTAPISSPNLDRLPLAFVPNAGQLDPGVRFQARGLGGTLFFTPDGVVLSLPVTPAHSKSDTQALGQPDGTKAARLRFEGRDAGARLIAAEPLPGRASYFRGGDSARWRANLPTFAGVTYAGLYPGVDLRYDGLGGQLKGTYTLAPGADPARIRWRYDGAASAGVDEASGDLRVSLPGAARPLIERAPAAWQEIRGRRVAVPARYAIRADGAIGFALGRYDPAYALTIDPTLSYSTYLGWNAGDTIQGIALDAAGNMYLAGTTASTDFPGPRLAQSVAGQGDLFVAKLSADGQTLLYSALIGGSGLDDVTSIAVGPGGRAFITGTTESSDFPTVKALQPDRGDRDGFVAALSADGARLDFSTYLGGSGMDWSYGIGVDGPGDVYVAGITASADFPQPAPTQPITQTSAFVTKLSGDGGALRYTTLLRGGEAHDLAVDAAGNAYITGQATGSFLAVKALQSCHAYNGDAFAAKLLPSGAVDFSTCFGGADGDYGDTIAVDPSGNIYIGGQTFSYDFPLVNAFDRTLGAATDAFVSKLSPDGQKILYSTFIGGYGMDWGYDIAADDHGNAYLTGYTESLAFPLANQLPMPGDANESCYSSNPCDAYLVKLNSTGNALLLGTHLGGHSYSGATSLALGAGAVYVAGWTQAEDFPTARPFQGQLVGGRDGFITKIDIPSTTLTNRLIDDVTGQPIPNASGTVALYAGASFLDGAAFTTDGQGAFTVEFSGPISQSVRLEYGGIAGYARQFYDRKPALGQADSVPLRSGLNTLTARLIPATVLEQTLLDDLTGLPIGNAAGALEVYSGTLLLERAPFTTNASGVATIALDTLIVQPARLGYVLDGYLKQYYDRKLALGQATPLALPGGLNRITTRLLPETRLINTLLDDATGQPIGLARGTLDVFSDTQLLDTQPFIADASGVYTTTFRVPIHQNVRLRYSVDGFARQFYDRAPTYDLAAQVALRAGTNALTARLARKTTLVNTLLDDTTGKPIAGASGSLDVYLGTQLVEARSFVTSQSGVYTTTFDALLAPGVTLEHLMVPGYARQFYDRKRQIGQATPLTFGPGQAALTTRLVPATTLVNTLLDDATGQPIAKTAGVLDVHLGADAHEQVVFVTDAAGVYTVTLDTLIDRNVQLEYRGVAGHARQFYDRKSWYSLANSLALRPGVNRLTSRLLPAPELAVTLLDDVTGRPIANAAGAFAVYSDTLPLESGAFTTDASGVFTTTLTNTFAGRGARLAFGNLAGYARQFYDRKPELARADSVVVGGGRTPITARLARATTLVNTLLDDATGQPIPGTVGFVTVYSGTAALETARFQTDATGVFTTALVSLVNQDARLAYQAAGYPLQYFDRKPSIEQADPVALHSGNNVLTTRLQTTRLIDTLIGDATGLPIPNTAGTLEVYSGTLLLDRLPFKTDDRGVFAVEFPRLMDQDVRLGYALTGYPYQFYDRATALDRAAPVRLVVGQTALTTRLASTTLVDTLIDDVTGAPIAGLAGTLEIYAGGVVLERQAFRTDASGVYTATLARLVDQNVQIAHGAPGYPQQFYDRRLALAQADPVPLKTGLNRLTARLLPETAVTATLLDDLTGQPIRDTWGTVVFYSATTRIYEAILSTDANGTFRLPFAQIVDQSARVEFRFPGYADQFYDRKMTLDQADPIALRPGPNILTARLVKVPTLTITLVDDPTGRPIPGIGGWLTVHWNGGQDAVQFTADANGAFTARFRSSEQTYPTVPFGVPLYLEFTGIPGYLDQFYDRVYQPGEATPVVLKPGANQLTTRITRLPTTLAATLKDGADPIRNRRAHVAIEQAGQRVFEGDYTTDYDGRIEMDLGWLVGADFRFRFRVDGFPDQYFGGTTRAEQATPVPLYSMVNIRTFQIARYPTIVDMLVDDATGAPIANVVGQLRVYTDTASFLTLPFDTDDNGGMLLQLEGLNVLNDDVRFAYEVAGYPAQFHDHRATYTEADPVLLLNGLTTFTTRLSRQVLPPAGAAGTISPESGGALSTAGSTALTLAFPPGAVAEPVSVTAAPVPFDRSSSGLAAVGPAFWVAASTAGGAPVVEFTQLFTLTVRYSAADLAGLDERSLRIAYWDAVGARWVDLPTQLDAAGDRVSAAAARAGRFVVLGQPRGAIFLPVARR